MQGCSSNEVTYCVNNSFCWASEEMQRTFDEAPVSLLWSNKMGLVTISLGHNSSHILPRQMLVEGELFQRSRQLIVKDGVYFLSTGASARCKGVSIVTMILS